MSTSTRRATSSDLAKIVFVHCSAFPRHFLTKLGRRSLYSYYKAVLAGHDGIIIVAENKTELIGFAAGVGDEGQLYRRLVFTAWSYLPYAILSIAKNRFAFSSVIYASSHLLRSLVAAPRLTSDMPRRDKGYKTCVLTSLAVIPDAGRRGVGRELVAAFTRAAEGQQFTRIVLETDADSNDGVLSFYRNIGFAVQETRVRPDSRRMVTFALALPIVDGDRC